MIGDVALGEIGADSDAPTKPTQVERSASPGQRTRRETLRP